MPYTVYIASDIFGKKVNLDLEFPFAPTLSELTKQCEYAFTAEQNSMRPGQHVPYQVSKFHVVDEVTDDWVEVLGANQLKNFCQLYSFQPHSTRYTESQGHIPPAKKGVMSYSGPSAHAPHTTAPPPAWTGASPHPGTPGNNMAIHHQGTSPPRAAYPSNVGSPYGAAPVAQKQGPHLLPDNVSHDDKVRITFEEADANKNRVLEMDEMQGTFRVCGLDFASSVMDDLYRKADFDRDGVISWPEWQRFCELYPALLDSLYYRLKAHFEHLAEVGRIDGVKEQRNGLVDRERQLQNNLDQLKSDHDDLQRRHGDADLKVQGAQDGLRSAEDAARDGAKDLDRARQAKADKEREFANERERERQAQLRAAESAREVEDATRKANAAQQNVDAAEATERRLLQALEDARREKERQQAIAADCRAAAAAAQDRHNQIIGDIPQTVELAKGALQDADRDLAGADQNQRGLSKAVHDAAQRVQDAARARDDLNRQLQSNRDRQDPCQRSLDEAKRAIQDHDRQVQDMEDRLTAEDKRKAALLDEEKMIVAQEVRLRQQRETLEDEETKLRGAHQQFFQSAGRVSPGRSRSPMGGAPTGNYATPTRQY